MFGEKIPSAERINIEEFRDKVLGCWTGKNIGGTLGTPLEGRREMSDLTFYQQELAEIPRPMTTSTCSWSGCSLWNSAEPTA